MGALLLLFMAGDRVGVPLDEGGPLSVTFWRLKGGSAGIP